MNRLPSANAPGVVMLCGQRQALPRNLARGDVLGSDVMGQVGTPEDRHLFLEAATIA